MSDAIASAAAPTEYDPTSSETQEDPYPLYRWLRDEAPVYHNERSGFWALSRFQGVWNATLDWKSFTSIHGQTLEKVAMPLPLMISMDPAPHTRVRGLVAKAFTPRRVGEMEPIVRQLTRERLAELEPGMQIDLFEQLASSMPMDAISTMLGVPPEHRDRVRHPTNELMHREPGELGMNARHAELAAEPFAVFRELIALRRRRRKDDLISALIWSTRAVELQGCTIPEDVRVLLLTGAAQRDPREYDDPDRFDIHRKIDRHLSFGFGQHLCLGRSLARQECRAAFEELLGRFPDYEIDEAELAWAHNDNVRGYAKVPMRL